MAKQLAPNTRVGPYTIAKALPQGKGGMARVYLALFRREGESLCHVAIKMAYTDDDAGKQQFFYDALNNEVEMLKKLNHPYIVRLYPMPYGTPRDPYIARETHLAGKPWYYAMEYLEGDSLHAYLKQQKKLAINEAVEIAVQVAMALEYMHDKQIAHLDVKPDNVLFRYPLHDGRALMEAVLIDFGIARRHSKPTGIEAGAYPYLPPERVRMARGEIPPEQVRDQRPADIYGVGMLLYRMLTGRLPFSGSKSHITSAILNEVPTQISRFRSDLPRGLEQVVQRTLDKDPRRRPTASELGMMLDEVLPPPRLSRKLSNGDSPPPPGTRPFRLAVGAAVLFGLLSVAECGIIARGRPAPTPVTATTVIMTTIPKKVATANPTTSVSGNNPHVSPVPVTPSRQPTISVPPPSVTPVSTFPPTITPRPITRTPAGRSKTQTSVPVKYPAPVLQEPPDNASLGLQMELRWQWNGTLADDEYFDVRVWKEGSQDHHGIAWTRESNFILKKNNIQEPGHYYWSIAVIQGKNAQVINVLSPEATPRTFSR